MNSADVPRSANASSSLHTTSGRRLPRTLSNFDDPIVTPKSFEGTWRKTDWDLARDLPLQPDDEVEARY